MMRDFLYSAFKVSIIVFVVLLMTSVSIGSAEEDDVLGTFKQGECVKLIQTCGNCSFVNISSVLYPNSNQALGQVQMTKQGTFYNYTFCDTSSLGTYRVNGFGDIDYPNIYETFTYVFIITPSGGAEDNTLFFFVMVGGAIILLVISFVFKNYVFSIISGFLFTGAGVYSMIYGFGDITSLYTRIMSFVLIGLGMIITITSAFEFAGEAEGSVDTVTYSDAEDD